MSNDARKSDRSKKIRRGFSRQVKKTSELKKGLAGIGSDGVWTYTPSSSGAAWGTSGSDPFTVSVSDGSSGHVHGLPLTIGTIPIKLPD